jgi:hypothetical protein
MQDRPPTDSHPDSADLDGTPRPRGLWGILNRSRVVDPRLVRAATGVLFVVYAIVSLVRFLDHHQMFGLAPRVVVLMYAAAGFALASRLSWSGLRCYTLGISLLLPGTTLMIAAGQSYASTGLGLLMVSTITALAFVQTARDLIAATIMIIVLHAVAFQVVPPPDTTIGIAWSLICVGVGIGIAVSVLVIAARAVTYENQCEWIERSRRERWQRDFAERAARSVTLPDIAGELGERFAATIPGSSCLFVLSDDGTLPGRVFSQEGLALPSVPPLVAQHWDRAATSTDGVLEVTVDAPLREPLGGGEGLACAPVSIVFLRLPSFPPALVVLLRPASDAISRDIREAWSATPVSLSSCGFRKLKPVTLPRSNFTSPR